LYLYIFLQKYEKARDKISGLATTLYSILIKHNNTTLKEEKISVVLNYVNKCP